MAVSYCHWQITYLITHIYLLKVNNENYRKICYICSKLTIKTICNFQSLRSPVEQNNLSPKCFCYITWLDATLDNLETKPLRQILLFPCNNSLGVTFTPNLSCKTSKWRFRFSPPTHPWKRQVWPNIIFAVKK